MTGENLLKLDVKSTTTQTYFAVHISEISYSGVIDIACLAHLQGSNRNSTHVSYTMTSANFGYSRIQVLIRTLDMSIQQSLMINATTRPEATITCLMTKVGDDHDNDDNGRLLGQISISLNILTTER